MVTAPKTVLPANALLSPTRGTAPFLTPVVVGAPPEPPLAVVVGAEGTKVASGLARHELAAALAADGVEGAAELTVPLPEKLQALASFFCSW